MPKLKENKKSQNETSNIEYIEQTHQAASTSVDMGTFGSRVDSSWVHWLMGHAGNYLLTSGLVFAVIRLGITLYRFIRSPNKNLSGTQLLGRTTIQTMVVAVAVIGALVAAPLFALATPILLVGTIFLDTMRNIGLLIWNIGKLAALRFKLRKELKDPLTRLKYEALKERYVNKIKTYAIASLIGLVVTAAATIIVIFPHFGLGIAAITVGVVAGFKITVAAIAGLSAAIAIAAPFVPPLVKSAAAGFMTLGRGIKNWLKDSVRSIRGKEVVKQPKQEPPKPSHGLKIPKDKAYEIKCPNTFQAALDNDQKLKDTFEGHRFREIVIEHTSDQKYARDALLHWIEEKMDNLTADMDKSTQSKSYFGEKEKPKRLQKLNALILMRQVLEKELTEEVVNKPDAVADQVNPKNIQETAELLVEHEENTAEIKNDWLSKYRDYFNKKIPIKELDQLDEQDIFSVLHTIETQLPGVKQSFFMPELSDTQNIVDALKVYAFNFQSNNKVQGHKMGL